MTSESAGPLRTRLTAGIGAALAIGGLGAALDRDPPFVGSFVEEPNRPVGADDAFLCQRDADCAFLDGVDPGSTQCVESRCVFTGTPPGRALGSFKLTFYWLVYESDFLRDRRKTDLYAPDGRHLGRYPASFARSLKMEGSGVTLSGSILNWAGRCPFGGGTCFDWVDKSLFPYGRGVDRFRLTPFRAVAVDPQLIPYGTPLYIPELDGVALPDGSVHDGCVAAVDCGGGIRAAHLDFFATSRADAMAVSRQMGQVRRVHPEEDAPGCGYATRFVEIPLPGDSR